MARGAGDVEDGAALAGVAAGDDGGGKARFPFRDELLFVGGGIAQDTPDFGEFRGERRVVEAANLAGVKGGNIGARNLFGVGTNVGEQGFREARARDERGDDVGAGRRIEAGVAPGEEFADGGVVGEAEAAGGDAGEFADAEELLADFAEVGAR